MINILGIETSCDDTAVSVVRDGTSILSNVIAAQTEMHEKYGGIIPEIASREHLMAIMPTVEAALEGAEISKEDLDAVAVTHGPGLAGSLLVGLNSAKGLALGWNKPLIGINHLEGHIYSAWLEDADPESQFGFPLICLIASGGHTDLVVMFEHMAYKVVGRTRDDAAGEAFDKVARMLGLGYPGGPAIEEQALQGDPKRYQLPRPLKGRKGCDFSFSGLKTAVANIVAKHGEDKDLLSDLCASFQEAIADVFVDRLDNARALINQPQSTPIDSLVLAGGVGANKCIRNRLSKRAAQLSLNFIVPPANLCTDNAAMVAWVGYESMSLGLVDGMLAPARARWPLDPEPHMHLERIDNG